MKIYLVMLLLISSTAFSQTNYYRYNSWRVPEKVGYSEPANNNPYPPYVSKIDVDAYREVGMEMQRRHNANLASIQALLREIDQSVTYLSRLDPALGKSATDKVNSYIYYLNNTRLNYARQDVYQNVVNNLNELNEVVNMAIDDTVTKLRGR